MCHKAFIRNFSQLRAILSRLLKVKLIDFRKSEKSIPRGSSQCAIFKFFSHFSSKLSPGENAPYCVLGAFWLFLTFFPKSTRMMCTKLEIDSSKAVTGSFQTYTHPHIHTDNRTYRGTKQGKSGQTRNTGL